MAGTTGDIVWRQRDPKTVELYNTTPLPPPTAPAAVETTEPETDPRLELEMQSMSGKQSSRSEQRDLYEREMRRQMMLEEMKKGERTPKGRKIAREEKDAIKKGLLGWERNREMFDTNTWIQGLYDRGFLTFDEDVGASINPNIKLAPGQMDAIGRAADLWADQVGLWSKGGFNPDNYRPYERQQYEEMRKR